MGEDSLSGALSRAPGSNVGNYTIDASALANGNYQISAQNGVLSITPRPITVAADAKTKTYGEADPALSYQITVGNLVSGDRLAGALSRTPGENIGQHAISAQGLSNSNYAITALDSSLLISPAVNANVIAGNTPSATTVIAVPPVASVPSFGNGGFTLVEVPSPSALPVPQSPQATNEANTPASSPVTAKSGESSSPPAVSGPGVTTAGTLRMMVVAGGIKLPEFNSAVSKPQEGGKE